MSTPTIMLDDIEPLTYGKVYVYVAVLKGNVEVVKNWLETQPSALSDEQYLRVARTAAAGGHMRCLELMVTTPFQDLDHTDAFVAALDEYPDIAELLWKYCREEVRNGEALCAAARHGRAKWVNLLRPRLGEESMGTQALANAAGSGHLDCLELLLPCSTPEDQGCSALAFAAAGGNQACLDFILPHSNPKYGNSIALINAAQNRHESIVKQLWNLSDPLDAFYHACKWERWTAAERLAEAASPEDWTQALNAAPRGAMPGLLARSLNHQLRQSLSDTGAPSKPARRL
jgi:hypothetical protein